MRHVRPLSEGVDFPQMLIEMERWAPTTQQQALLRCDTDALRVQSAKQQWKYVQSLMEKYSTNLHSEYHCHHAIREVNDALACDWHGDVQIGRAFESE